MNIRQIFWFCKQGCRAILKCMCISLSWNTMLCVGRDSEIRVTIITECLSHVMYTVLCISSSIATEYVIIRENSAERGQLWRALWPHCPGAPMPTAHRWEQPSTNQAFTSNLAWAGAVFERKVFRSSEGSTPAVPERPNATVGDMKLKQLRHSGYLRAFLQPMAPLEGCFLLSCQRCRKKGRKVKGFQERYEVYLETG